MSEADKKYSGVSNSEVDVIVPGIDGKKSEKLKDVNVNERTGKSFRLHSYIFIQN